MDAPAHWDVRASPDSPRESKHLGKHPTPTSNTAPAATDTDWCLEMAVVRKGDQSAERQRVSLRELRRKKKKRARATRYNCVGLQARLTFRMADLGGAGNAPVYECVHMCQTMSPCVCVCAYMFEGGRRVNVNSGKTLRSIKLYRSINQAGRILPRHFKRPHQTR